MFAGGNISFVFRPSRNSFRHSVGAFACDFATEKLKENKNRRKYEMQMEKEKTESIVENRNAESSTRPPSDSNFI